MRHATPTSDNERPPNGQQGFTLLEVVIAVTIFSIGLLAASMMQSASIKGNKSSTALTQASNWASGKTEEIISWPYDDARLQAGVHTEISPDGRYTITWTVTTNTPITNTKTVVINASWTLRGRTINSQFTEIRFQPI